MGQSYSDPRYGVTKSAGMGEINANIATGSIRTTWAPPENITLTAVRFSCEVAGTATGANAIEARILSGTTSIGVTSGLGTAALRGITTVTLSQAMSSGDTLVIQNIQSDATGVWNAQADYTERFLAT